MKIKILILAILLPKVLLSDTKGVKLEFEVFSQNQKIGEAVWYFQDFAAKGLRIYNFLNKRVLDSVFCIFDQNGMPVRVRRHEIVSILARETLTSRSEALYFKDSVVVEKPKGGSWVFRDTLPLIDFDLMPFVLPKFVKPLTGYSRELILVFPMAQRVERCKAIVGKGEIVNFAGHRIKVYVVEIERAQKPPIKIWFGEDGLPIRYYDQAAEFQLFRKF